MSASHPLLKFGSGHEADSGYSCGNLVMQLPEGISEFQVQLASKSLLNNAAVVEAKPISHAP